MKSCGKKRLPFDDSIIHERGIIDKCFKNIRGIEIVYILFLKLFKNAFAAFERYASLSVTTLSSQNAP